MKIFLKHVLENIPSATHPSFRDSKTMEELPVIWHPLLGVLGASSGLDGQDFTLRAVKCRADALRRNSKMRRGTTSNNFGSPLNFRMLRFGARKIHHHHHHHHHHHPVVWPFGHRFFDAGRCVDEKFQADREVVLLAVNQCGHTLAFASESLKAIEQGLQ